MRWQHLVCLPSRPSMSIHRHQLVWARVGRGRSGCMHRNLLRLLVGRLWRLRLVRLRVRRRLWRFCTLIASGSPAAPTSCGRCRRTQHLQVDRRRFAVRVQSLVAFAHQLGIVCATLMSATGRMPLGENDIRKPHALHNVRAPSGPRRHSGVSRMLHEWHFPGGVARWT